MSILILHLSVLYFPNLSVSLPLPNLTLCLHSSTQNHPLSVSSMCISLIHLSTWLPHSSPMHLSLPIHHSSLTLIHHPIHLPCDRSLPSSLRSPSSKNHHPLSWTHQKTRQARGCSRRPTDLSPGAAAALLPWNSSRWKNKVFRLLTISLMLSLLPRVSGLLVDWSGDWLAWRMALWRVTGYPVGWVFGCRASCLKLHYCLCVVFGSFEILLGLYFKVPAVYLEGL